MRLDRKFSRKQQFLCHDFLIIYRSRKISLYRTQFGKTFEVPIAELLIAAELFGLQLSISKDFEDII